MVIAFQGHKYGNTLSILNLSYINHAHCSSGKGVSFLVLMKTMYSGWNSRLCVPSWSILEIPHNLDKDYRLWRRPLWHHSVVSTVFPTLAWSLNVNRKIKKPFSLRSCTSLRIEMIERHFLLSWMYSTWSRSYRKTIYS